MGFASGGNRTFKAFREWLTSGEQGAATGAKRLGVLQVTMTTADASGHIGARANPAVSTGFPVPLAIALALGIGLAFTWPRVTAVWQTGAFFDTDDAMRMVQVRDLMAGQGWFDYDRPSPQSAGRAVHALVARG